MWQVHEGWSKNAQLVHCGQRRLEWRARELYIAYDGDMDKVLAKLCDETGWTIQQAYQFTDKMFCTENHN